MGDVEEKRLISVMAKVNFLSLVKKGELKQACVFTLMALFGKATSMNISSLSAKWKMNRNQFNENVEKVCCFLIVLIRLFI